MTAWRTEPGSVLLQVRVTPKGGRDEIVGLRTSSDGRLHLALKVSAPPEDGAANEALTRLISRAAGIGRSAVTIISGEHAREKRLKLAGDPVAILARFEAMGFGE